MRDRIVDWLSARADLVMRLQGGHIDGHVPVLGDQADKLSLPPLL